jgi:hypothetical protein
MKARALPICTLAGLAAFVACSSTGNSGFVGTMDSGGGKGDSSSGSHTDSGHTGNGDATLKGQDSGSHDSAACASATFEAQGSPAALLFILDASGSMGMDNKYAYAQQAIVAAMDQPVFDSMSLGLLLYPQPTTVAAACPELLGIGVNCVVSGLPQVPLQLAGMNTSSSSSGVRHDMYTTLVASAPASAPGNGNPMYDAFASGINTLQSFPLNGKRILFFVTDGGASCTSQDMPQRPYYADGNGCDDYEDPSNIVTMLAMAHNDATAPVNSLIVGVEGADTTAADFPNAPPYSVQLALSAYALAGSPETAPSGCEGVYTKSGSPPATPCFFDLTSTPNFTSTLSTDIGLIRNKLLGCTFLLPTPEAGAVSLEQVNVDYSVNGGAAVELEKRSMSTDMCLTGNGCWDYTGNNTEVELIGNACTAVESSGTSKVQIIIGCATLIK